MAWFLAGASIVFSAKCDEAAKNVFVTDSNGILSVLDMKSGKEIAKTEGYPKTEIPPRVRKNWMVFSLLFFPLILKSNYTTPTKGRGINKVPLIYPHLFSNLEI